MTSRKRHSTQHDLANDDDNSIEPQQRKKMKSTSATQSASTDPKTDTNGDPYWEISRQRRVTVSTFRGKTMINVREYYEKDGQDLPGKKVCCALPGSRGIVYLTDLALIGNIHDLRTVQRSGCFVTQP